MSIESFSLSVMTLLVLSSCQLTLKQRGLALPVPDAFASGTKHLVVDGT